MNDYSKRRIGDQHHQQAERYRILALIESTKGHLAGERGKKNRRSLHEALDYFQRDLAALEQTMGGIGSVVSNVVNFVRRRAG
jgi:hypothetical protein